MVMPLAAFVVLAALLLRPGLAARLRAQLVTKSSADKLFSIAAVAAALVVLFQGHVWAALCLFGLAMWLLGRSDGSRSANRSPVSVVRSTSVEIETDVATGRQSARIIAGPHFGAVLDRLGLDGCLAILAACRGADLVGARLLEDYLDGRSPGWRTAADRDHDPRPGRARVSGEMSEEQAYQLLGLARGASRETIVRAHRAVMKRWHPDQGGTAELAARANQAKEVLLRRHA